MVKKMQYLSHGEANAFIDQMVSNRNDDYISYSILQRKFDEAYDDLVHQPGPHQGMKRREDTREHDAILRTFVGDGWQELSRSAFSNLVHQWNVPSMQHEKEQETRAYNYFDVGPHHRRRRWRKIRAYWAVYGSETVCVGLIIIAVVGFSIWQLLKFVRDPYLAAFGPGVVVAKTCTGALYPTFFVLLLSVSRYFATAMRRWHACARFLGLDLAKNFHILVAYAALMLSTIHAISHMTGTFVQGSKTANSAAIDNIIGENKLGQRRYIDYIRSVPGYTGITALILFYAIAALSMPWVRRRHYNTFQYGHLLIYPLLALLLAHGSASLLQHPIFGYIVALPMLLVILERASRMISGFYGIEAKLRVLDSETVEITVTLPKYRMWDYTAGQYIFLQVPEISFFQWHPFTISRCRDKSFMLHIKTSGDWTAKLRQLPSDIKVGVNGPFGAPAQRFYSFKYSLIIGTGVGITPFSAILADLQYKSDYGGLGRGVRDVSDDRGLEQRTEACLQTIDQNEDTGTGGDINRQKEAQRCKSPTTDLRRRTDFHWIVRDGDYLMWLNDLLNYVSMRQTHYREQHKRPHQIDIRINTHITTSRKDIVTHVFGWLLEMKRTEQNTKSPLTGLLNPTNFGRPDFDQILDEHYNDMQAIKMSTQSGNSKHGSRPRYVVGVFYCGAAEVGKILADKCRELTIRGREDGSKIEYHFMIESFN